MDKEALKTLSSEKIHNTIFKYWLHPESVYIKTTDSADNIIFDDTIKVDLFKIDKLIKDLHKLSETYQFNIFIRYKGFSKDDVLISFKHSL
jgi:hypothetical protein